MDIPSVNETGAGLRYGIIQRCIYPLPALISTALVICTGTGLRGFVDYGEEKATEPRKASAARMTSAVKTSTSLQNAPSTAVN